MASEKMCLWSHDAPHCWYLQVREEPCQLDCNASKLENDLFFGIEDGCLCGIIVCFVDDLPLGGS